MNTILYGFFYFTIFFIINIIYWRVTKPVGEVRPLLIVFIISTCIIHIICIANNLSNILSFILYCALSFAYILTFPAINIIIPSFKILMLINESGSLSLQEIIIYFTNDEIYNSRINLLKNDGLLRNQNSNFQLGLSGKIVAIIFITYRKILGAPVGKG